MSVEDIERGGYVVIDIKFSTLPLIKNSLILRSEIKTKLYKSQLWMYNEMLKEAYGRGFNYAFIIGRGIERVGERINTFDEIPGKMVFDDEFGREMVDIIEKKRLFEELIGQIRFGDLLILPNMKVPEQYDDGWSQAKRAIAEKYGEITLLPNCGVIHRETARRAGVLSFTNPSCTSKTLGISGPVISELVNRVAWINRCTDQIMNPLNISDEVG